MSLDDEVCKVGIPVGLENRREGRGEHSEPSVNGLNPGFGPQPEGGGFDLTSPRGLIPWYPACFGFPGTIFHCFQE